MWCLFLEIQVRHAFYPSLLLFSCTCRIKSTALVALEKGSVSIQRL